MGIFNKTSYLQNQNDWRCVDLIFFSLYVSHILFERAIDQRRVMIGQFLKIDHIYYIKNNV